MKTTNIILLGVVGVGAVGAYMYMKNKQAKEALLSGSLPATNQGGVTIPSTIPSGTTPSGTTPSATTPTGTTTSGTTAQNSEVFLPSDNDLKLVEATVLLGEIKKAKIELVESKKPFTGRKDTGWFNQNTDEYKAYLSRKQNALPKLKALIIKLHNLDYTLDANDNLVKLNPNRDKVKSLKAINLQYDIKGIRDAMNEPFEGAKFKNSISQNEDRPTDWTLEYLMYRTIQDNSKPTIEKKLTELDDLDYTLDANDNLVVLDPNRNKEWIKVQKLYMSLVNLSPFGLAVNQSKVTELAKLGYKIDPVTKKLITI
jgi:hypothetical protein